jgi:hypothetical protein
LQQLIATANFVGIRVPRMRLSCRGHLTRTGGRDGAETHGEDRRERGIGEQGQNSPIDLQANVPTRRLKRLRRASDAPRFVVAR